MHPTVSIIVPIYNAEPYLHRCIDSILNQEYTDFELILADDGSTDASRAICDEYAANDSRIFVIHKENSGVSDTRNMAINRATGTYLQFLDSDDWITPDATKLFVRAASEHNCDLVIADFYRVVGERVSHKGDIEADGVLTKEEFAAYMMENPADFYYGVLWNKLYRRDIVEKYKLCMNTAVSWCEDFLFNLEYILHADVFYALQAPVYYYVKRKGSLVATQGLGISKTIKMKFMVFEYYNEFYKNVYDEKDYEKKKLSVYRFFVDAARDGIVAPTILPGSKKLGEERNSVFAEGIAQNGALMDAYRHRKLMERYLDIVALRNDLTLQDVSLLLYLSHASDVRSKKDLADFTGMSRNSLSRSMQRLISKSYIKVTEIREPRENFSKEKLPTEKKHSFTAANNKKQASLRSSHKASEKYMHIELLPAAEMLLPELTTAEKDYDTVRFDGFSLEEREEYERLSEKIKENMQKTLLT